MTFTNKQKYECAERELNMRKRVYPRWVAQSKMTQASADKETQTMEAIMLDYMHLARMDEMAEQAKAPVML